MEENSGFLKIYFLSQNKCQNLNMGNKRKVIERILILLYYDYWYYLLFKLSLYIAINILKKYSNVCYCLNRLIVYFRNIKFL